MTYPILHLFLTWYNGNSTMLKIDVILDMSFKEISDHELPWYHVENRCNIGLVIHDH
jgi:hypothetical protein